MVGLIPVFVHTGGVGAFVHQAGDLLVANPSVIDIVA
jgi:hypothetical protein